MAGLVWVPDKGIVWQTDIQQYIRAHNAFTPDAIHYRFYQDGSESGSTPRDGEDTDVTMDPSTDTQVHLRIMLQETGGDTNNGGFQIQLQYDKNSLGSWNDVNGSSSNIQSDPGATPTDQSNTTNRSTDGLTDPGSGTFDAGEVDKVNGLAGNALNAGNFSEYLFCLVLQSGDLTGGDTLDFRLLDPTSTFASTMGVPRITIAAGDTSPQEALSANQHLNQFYFPWSTPRMVPAGQLGKSTAKEPVD